jgi:cell shape-determining protein MreD
MGALRRFYHHLLQGLPIFTLLLADAFDLFLTPWLSAQGPLFMALTLYSWLVQRPERLYPSILFLQGGIHDLLVGDPLGFSFLMMLGSVVVVSYIRPFLLGRSFLKAWGGCCVMFLSLLLFKQSFALIWLKQPLPLLPMGTSTLLSLGFYPLLARLFIRMLPQRESIKG